MRKVALRFIRFYQRYLNFSGLARYLFLTDKACRFRPTCSQYCYQAIEKYGIMRGSWLGLKRIVRCHPFSEGGNNPLK